MQHYKYLINKSKCKWLNGREIITDQKKSEDCFQEKKSCNNLHLKKREGIILHEQSTQQGTAYIVFKWIIRSKYLPKGQKWRQDLITKKSYNSEKHRKRIHHKQKCHFRNSSKNDSSTTARSKTYQMNQSSNGFWSDNKNYHSNGC